MICTEARTREKTKWRKRRKRKKETVGGMPYLSQKIRSQLSHATSRLRDLEIVSLATDAKTEIGSHVQGFRPI
jgi:hypothetical protein